MRWRRCLVFHVLGYSLLVPLLLFLTGSPAALAACLIETGSPDDPATFTRHLSKDCSAEERQAHAVPASELLTALQEGKNLDLAGVVIIGDLILDQLPLVTAGPLETFPPLLQKAMSEQHVQHVRVIDGAVSIRDSLVRGVVSTKLKQGYLIVKGPVTMVGTTFERSVDFTRTAFNGRVDFSEAIFYREAFFLQALFEQGARFAKTGFGVHSRFHRAVFGGETTFLRAGFNGLAEFLEVTFEGDASFSRAYFKMGTGFSGSRFGGALDFSEALFEREVFFLFAVFEKDAYFRRSTFRAQADFSDAQFKGVDDFTKTFFKMAPRFDRTRISPIPATQGGLQDPHFLYGIVVSLTIFTAVFVLVLRKR